jgi:hypothetical protein
MSRFAPVSIAAVIAALGFSTAYWVDALTLPDAAIGLGLSGVLAILGLKER